MGTWEANVYCNNHKVETIKIKSSFTLEEIRKVCGNSIPKDEHYYFLSRKGLIIKDEKNFKASDVYKEDEKDSYKINLTTIEELEQKPFYVTSYLNDQHPSALLIPYKSKLKDIKTKLSKTYQKQNESSIFFVTKDDIPIGNENLDDFSIKDIIRYKDGKKLIRIFERDYYNRIQVIKQLKKLEKDADNGISINWYLEREFFKRIDELAGKEIANIIKRDLQRNDQEANTTDTPGNDNNVENKKKSDKDYIKQYLKILLDIDDTSSAPPSSI